MIETLAEFNKRVNPTAAPSATAYQKAGEYFDVQPSECKLGTTTFNYRDFYKVALVTHLGKLYYADKWIEVDRPAILFSSPLIPYAWEPTGMGIGNGYYCVFNEKFLNSGDRNSLLAATPVFDISMERIYFIDDKTVESTRALFRKMMDELKSDYAGKADIVRSYMHLLVHEAMKMQDTSTYVPQKSAAQRTAELFLALLERQFPVDIPNKTLELKTPNDYAERLSVHVNHLNRVVKSTTGRTTSTLITGRIIQEAVQLLQHSNYSVGEIAFALGFEETASFSNFIKKHTDISPTTHRSLLNV
ncbi:MAG: helix-turn-helix transcriptional regulator [Bacteroides sp.]|nr:helix-turn-helix transcriptional regulator [Bacteroides sp.]